MNKIEYIGIIILGFAATIWSWGPEIHEKMAKEILLHCNPEIAAAFSQTGWNVNNVADYAKRADGLNPLWPGDFYYTEKQVFPGMWESIRDNNKFTNDYLSYAWAGKMAFGDGFWQSTLPSQIMPIKIYDYQISKAQQANFRFWSYLGLFAHHAETVYSGEQLFGIFLHQVVDCCVPVDHAPANANERCSDNQAGEAFLEYQSETEPVNRWSGKYVVTSFSSEEDYYKKYCIIFYDNMQVHAADFCGLMAVSGVPIEPISWIAQGCFKDGFELANVVVLRYLNAVLHKVNVNIAPQLVFNREQETILNPQLVLGTSYLPMKLNLNGIPSSEIKVIVTVLIPDKNDIPHYYEIYNGKWISLNGLNGEVRPLMWPSEEIKKTDGTAGNEMNAVCKVDAFVSGYLPYLGWIRVSKGDLVLARNNSMRQILNLTFRASGVSFFWIYPGSI